jgi:hypothetical protein
MASWDARMEEALERQQEATEACRARNEKTSPEGLERRAEIGRGCVRDLRLGRFHFR